MLKNEAAWSMCALALSAAIMGCERSQAPAPAPIAADALAQPEPSRDVVFRVAFDHDGDGRDEAVVFTRRVEEGSGVWDDDVAFDVALAGPGAGSPAPGPLPVERWLPSFYEHALTHSQSGDELAALMMTVAEMKRLGLTPEDPKRAFDLVFGRLFGDEPAPGFWFFVSSGDDVYPWPLTPAQRGRLITHARGSGRNKDLALRTLLRLGEGVEERAEVVRLVGELSSRMSFKFGADVKEPSIPELTTSELEAVCDVIASGLRDEQLTWDQRVTPTYTAFESMPYCARAAFFVLERGDLYSPLEVTAALDALVASREAIEGLVEDPEVDVAARLMKLLGAEDGRYEERVVQLALAGDVFRYELDPALASDGVEVRVQALRDGELGVPFDHDGDGVSERVELVTSRPDSMSAEWADVTATLRDARGRAPSEPVLPVDIWLPRLFTHLLVSDGIVGRDDAILLATTAMKRRELLPHSPDAAFEGAMRGLLQSDEGFDVRSAEAHARALYFPLSQGQRARVLGVAAGKSRARDLALGVLLARTQGHVSSEDFFPILSTRAFGDDEAAPLAPSLGLDPAVVEALCVELSGRLVTATGEERVRLVARGLDSSLVCDAAASEVLANTEMYPLELVVGSISLVGPARAEDGERVILRVHSAKRRRELEERARRDQGLLLPLLSHGDARVRAAAAHGVHEGATSHAALRELLPKEADAAARSAMESALTRHDEALRRWGSSYRRPERTQKEMELRNRRRMHHD